MQKSSLRQSLDIFSCSIRFQSLPIHLKLWPGHIFIVVSAGKNNRKGQKQENQEKPWSPCHHFLPPSLSPAFCCWVIPALPSHPIPHTLISKASRPVITREANWHIPPSSLPWESGMFAVSTSFQMTAASSPTQEGGMAAGYILLQD